MVHSTFHGSHVITAEEEQGTVPAGGEDRTLLFTTKTCPNCVIARKALEEAGIACEIVDAGEQKDLVKQYGVMQAPTLVVTETEKLRKSQMRPILQNTRKNIACRCLKIRKRRTVAIPFSFFMTMDQSLTGKSRLFTVFRVFGVLASQSGIPSQHKMILP